MVRKRVELSLKNENKKFELTALATTFFAWPGRAYLAWLFQRLMNINEKFYAIFSLSLLSLSFREESLTTLRRAKSLKQERKTLGMPSKANKRLDLAE